MGMITIGDLEVATNSTIDEEDYPYYQNMIDVVTAYIETETGQSFTEVTEEVQLCQTTRLGSINWPSITGVSKVEQLDPYSDTFTDLPVGSYGFNRIDRVYGLDPYTTYRVTVSYGWDVVPTDIAGVAAALVAAGTGLVPGSAAGLASYRVGDVEERYGVTDDGSGRVSVTLTGLQSAVLSAYSTYNRTWVL